DELVDGVHGLAGARPRGADPVHDLRFLGRIEVDSTLDRLLRLMGCLHGYLIALPRDLALLDMVSRQRLTVLLAGSQLPGSLKLLQLLLRSVILCIRSDQQRGRSDE